MHEYVSVWEHRLFQHPGMPMPPWPAQRRREPDQHYHRTCPALCDLANSTQSYLLCLASRNQRPVLHTWSLPNVTHWDKAEGGCMVQEKKLSCFFCFLVQSTGEVIIVFLCCSSQGLRSKRTLTCGQVWIRQNNFRILLVCCFWNYFLWIGMKLAWRCTCLPGLLFALGILYPFCNISTELYSQMYT